MVFSRDDLTYLFGRCEVRVATREILVDGTAQAVTPKVYELLVHLLAERHRAVSKDELVSKVWRGAVLSDSVLARTVMMARRLIGDDASRPVWIQNVHGFGYRFVGPVTESARPAPAFSPAIPLAQADAAAVPAQGPEVRETVRRLGLFPLIDLTENRQLAWTQVGLMALVGHALERDKRLEVRAVDPSFQAGVRSGANTAGEAARQARELLGLDHVLQVTMRKQGESLWMDYQVFSDQPASAVGSLRDVEPLALAERLAQEVATHVLDGSNRSGPLLSSDPFVNQAYARAMAFAEVQNWPVAAALLGAAIVLEPDPLALELERARMLMWQQDPQVVDMAAGILKRLGPQHEARLHSRAHDLMALALQMRADPAAAEQIERHRQLSLQACSEAEPADWTIGMYINGGNYFVDRGDFVKARRYLDRAIDDARATGNSLKLALALQNSAVVDRAEGDLVRARQRLEESLRIWRMLPKRPLRAHALVQMAYVNLGLGLLEEARQQADEALSCLDLGRLQGYEAATASNICLMYLDLGRVADVKDLATSFGASAPDEARNMSPRSAAAACAAQVQGDVLTARRHLWTVVHNSRQWPGINWMRNWLLALLQLEMACGTPDKLAEVREAIEQLLLVAHQPELNAGIGRCHAAAYHLQQQDAQALATLLAVVHETAPGKAANLARFDAAWLQLEAGHAEDAAALMAVSRTWRDGHPAGMAAHARWHAAEGRYAEAYTLQQQALARWLCQAHPAQVALAQAYARAAAQSLAAQPVAALPRLPRLLSATWVPGAFG